MAPGCMVDVCVCFCVFLLGRCQKYEKPPLSWPCRSVTRFGITRIPLDGISWKFILENFFKICRENSMFIKM